MAITKNTPGGEEKKDLNQGQEKQNLDSSKKDLFGKKEAEPVVGEVSEEQHDELFEMRKSLDEQRELTASMQETLKAVIEQNKQLMQSLNSGKTPIQIGSKDKTGYVEDLLDDYIEEPVIFFGFTCGLGVWGDKNMGNITLPPNGPIKFKLIVRSKRLTHKGVQVVSVSHYASNSKKEIEYLRNHSKFGIQFFENKEQVKAMDYTTATKLAESSNIVNTLSDVQMIARCKLEGISITNDPKVMRMELTKVLADKLLNSTKSLALGEFDPSKQSGDRIIKAGVVKPV